MGITSGFLPHYKISKRSVPFTLNLSYALYGYHTDPPGPQLWSVTIL